MRRKPYPCSWQPFAYGVFNGQPVVWEVILNRRNRVWHVRSVQSLPWGPLKGAKVPVHPSLGRACYEATVSPESGEGQYPTLFNGGPPTPNKQPEPTITVRQEWLDGRVWQMPAQPGLRQALMAYCRKNRVRALFPDSGMAGDSEEFLFQALGD